MDLIQVPIGCRLCRELPDALIQRAVQQQIRAGALGALVLRDACTPEEYQVVKDVVKVYVWLDGEEFDPPLRWLEEIPVLARGYRSTEAPTKTA